MHAQTVADHLRSQAAACRQLGSPLYADLLVHAAADVEAGNGLVGLLPDVDPAVAADPGPPALGLRLLGAVHRLVLAGRAPELAAHYPSAGGTPGPPGRVWASFRETVTAARHTVLAGMAGPPQTNEVGRSAVLLGGLTAVSARAGLPVRLCEVGASAGLNLRPDLVACAGRGPADSPVDLGPDSWRGAVVPAVTPVVVERVGGDVDPLDPTDPEDVLTLRAYLWPDQIRRRHRLDGAVALARRLPVTVGRARAADLVTGLVPRPGTVTVVWHSLVRQYLPGDERAGLDAALERLGGAATADAPVAHLAFEPARVRGTLRFLITVRMWPDAGEELLGAAAPHGTPVTWSPAVWARPRPTPRPR